MLGQQWVRRGGEPAQQWTFSLLIALPGLILSQHKLDSHCEYHSETSVPSGGTRHCLPSPPSP